MEIYDESHYIKRHRVMTLNVNEFVSKIVDEIIINKLDFTTKVKVYDSRTVSRVCGT